MGTEWGQRAEEQPFFPVPTLAWNPGGNEALYWLALVGGSLPTEGTAQSSTLCPGARGPA